MPAERSPMKSRKQDGFTVVELMVGVAIGLLLVLVITQVMGVFESRNRATMGSADAQTNGAIALYTIGRDLEMAGYSLMPEENSALECAAITNNVPSLGGIAPVSITDGVAAAGVSASDTLTIRYGNSLKGGVMTTIEAAPVGNNVTVTNNLGCRVADVAMILNGPNCALTTVTGPADIAAPAPANTKTVTLQNTTGAVSGASIACLGAWTEVTYAVSNGNLMRNGVPLLSGIVNLQAQFGISAIANSNQIANWVDAAGATWGAPSLANRNRIKAVRLAVIARNDKRDPAEVSNACSSTTAASPSGLCAWEGSAASPAPAVDLAPGDPDWRHYRYRSFETIIPLRNVIWARDTL